MKKTGNLLMIIVFTFFSIFGVSVNTTSAESISELHSQKLEFYGFKNTKFKKTPERSELRALKRYNNHEYDAIATMDENTKDIVLEIDNRDENKSEIYQVDIHEADDDLLVATFTNKDTGEKYEVDNTSATSNFAFVVPIGIVIGEAVVAHLLAASLAIVVAGATYVAVTEVATKLRNNKRYDHYAASLNKAKTNLYIGPSLTYKQAMSNLKSGDVWSLSKSLAKKVAQGAGANRIPVGPEIHNKDKNGKIKSGNYYHHYHVYDRSGGHSFY